MTNQLAIISTSRGNNANKKESKMISVTTSIIEGNKYWKTTDVRGNVTTVTMMGVDMVVMTNKSAPKYVEDAKLSKVAAELVDFVRDELAA